MCLICTACFFDQRNIILWNKSWYFFFIIGKLLDERIVPHNFYIYLIKIHKVNIHDNLINSIVSEWKMKIRAKVLYIKLLISNCFKKTLWNKKMIIYYIAAKLNWKYIKNEWKAVEKQKWKKVNIRLSLIIFFYRMNIKPISMSKLVA